jgi:hypothetical protein
MIIKLYCTTLLFALTTLAVKGQNNVYQLTDSPLDYKYICFLTLGEMEYFDDFENDGEAGFRYRLIVDRFETHESLFIEKIIVDVEGIPNKIAWCKRVNLKPLMEKYKLEKESTLIESLEWQTQKSFDFNLNGKHFYVKIKDDNNIEVI